MKKRLGRNTMHISKSAFKPILFNSHLFKISTFCVTVTNQKAFFDIRRLNGKTHQRTVSNQTDKTSVSSMRVIHTSRRRRFVFTSKEASFLFSALRLCLTFRLREFQASLSHARPRSVNLPIHFLLIHLPSALSIRPDQLPQTEFCFVRVEC